MPLVTWDSSYSVQVKSFDEAHQKLFGLVNALHDAMKEGRGGEILAETVTELRKYTLTHFHAEELVMERAHYPKLIEHRIEHQKFIAHVTEFENALAKGSTDGSVVVLAVLKDWLANHIQKTDKLYSGHLNSQGIH